MFKGGEYSGGVIHLRRGNDTANYLKAAHVQKDIPNEFMGIMT